MKGLTGFYRDLKQIQITRKMGRKGILSFALGLCGLVLLMQCSQAVQSCPCAPISDSSACNGRTVTLISENPERQDSTLIPLELATWNQNTIECSNLRKNSLFILSSTGDSIQRLSRECENIKKWEEGYKKVNTDNYSFIRHSDITRSITLAQLDSELESSYDSPRYDSSIRLVTTFSVW